MFTSRRRFVSALGMGGLMLPAMARSATLTPTPSETLGPFFPLTRPLDQDADLTMLAGNSQRALGEVIEMTGRVLYDDGTPVEGAILDIWQANSVGRYTSALDTSAPALDPNFQGSAKLVTGKDGQWRIVTIKPGAYAIGGGLVRTRHIHWEILTAYGRFGTQSYFPGEALNEADILLAPQLARGAAPASLIANHTGTRADGVAQFNWDVVLRRPG